MTRQKITTFLWFDSRAEEAANFYVSVFQDSRITSIPQFVSQLHSGEIMPNTTITPYLFFAGRCEEALGFYRQALGADIEMIMRFSDSPEPTPPGMLQAGFENKVMHASFHIGEVRMMASDGCDDKSKFDGFRLALTVSTEAEAHKAFNALAEGGSIMMPLSKTFWSPCYGMVTDKFNVGWMVMVPG